MLKAAGVVEADKLIFDAALLDLIEMRHGIDSDDPRALSVALHRDLMSLYRSPFAVEVETHAGFVPPRTNRVRK